MKPILAFVIVAGMCAQGQSAAAAAAAERAAKRAQLRKEAEAERAAKRDAAIKSRETARAEAGSRPAPDKDRGAVAAEPADQGITGPMHEKFLRKIVFTRVDKDMASISEADVIQEINLGEPLFFRLYLEKSSPKLLKAKMAEFSDSDISGALRWGVRFTVAGKAPVETLMEKWGTRQERAKWTTWRGVFVKDGPTTIPGMDTFGEFVSRGLIQGTISPGKNRVKVEMYPVGYKNTTGKDERIDGEIAATGEITVNYAGAITPASKLCSPHPARLKDPGIETAILRLAQKQWNTQEHKPVKVEITHDGWTIRRNQLTGVVTGRSIDATIMARGAEYCQWEGYHYLQPHNGSGFEPGGEFTNAAGAHFMPCACIGK